MRNTRKGFTLVELLVVIAILAILATVSVVGYTSFINNANDSVALSELTQIRDYHIANEYLTPGQEPSDLGLDGELTKGTVNGATCYKYVGAKGGVAYWYTADNSVTTTAPEGWTAAGSTPATPAHTCEHVCATCGKCEDSDCTETACANKCGGHAPAHTHSYTSSVTNPTCTAGGYTTYTCSCGDSYTDNEVPATHNYSGKTCTVCGTANPNFAQVIPTNMTFTSLTSSNDSTTVLNGYGWTVKGAIGTCYAGALGLKGSKGVTYVLTSSEIAITQAFTVTIELKGQAGDSKPESMTSTITFTLIDENGNTIATGYPEGSTEAAITTVHGVYGTETVSFVFVDGKTWTDATNVVISYHKEAGNIAVKSLTFNQ